MENSRLSMRVRKDSREFRKKAIWLFTRRDICRQSFPGERFWSPLTLFRGSIAASLVMARSNNFSAAQVRQYGRDGIAYPLSVMSLGEAQRFRSAFEELEVYLDRRLEYVAMTHLYFRWAFEFATWPKILNLVEQILGPEVLIQGSLILC